MGCARAAAGLMPCLGCELGAVLRTFPSSWAAPWQVRHRGGNSSGDLVFHHSITLPWEGPLRLVLGSVGSSGIQRQLRPARAGRCVW